MQYGYGTNAYRQRSAPLCMLCGALPCAASSSNAWQGLLRAVGLGLVQATLPASGPRLPASGHTKRWLASACHYLGLPDGFIVVMLRNEPRLGGMWPRLADLGRGRRWVRRGEENARRLRQTASRAAASRAAV